MPSEGDLISIPELSASEDKLVILVLTMIRNTTNFSLYADLQMQTVYNSGAMATLHHILKRKDDIKNPEILSITVGIVAKAMQSLDITGKAMSLSPTDFMDVLMQIIRCSFCLSTVLLICSHFGPPSCSSTDEKSSTHALSTMRSLISSFDKGAANDDHLNLRKRVVHNGIVPKLTDICHQTTDADAIREVMRIVMLLGSTPTVLEEVHVRALSQAVVDVATKCV